MSKGLVIKSTGSWYYVQDEQENIVPCKIKGTYRIKGIKATNPVSVGDVVEYELVVGEDKGVITEISPRKNYIIRRSTKLSSQYQLIASNIDQALLVVSLVKPKTLLGFIDRFLVSAEAFRIPVIILFNKTDLYTDDDLEEMHYLADLYSSAGYSCIPLSLKTGYNLDTVKKLMSSSVSVISGNSGVGKTTLLNTLDPELNLKTREVSEHYKLGQHTTTYAEMFFLQSGAKVIDTPGIKGFGMVDVDKEELYHFFPEIFKASKNCKFHNCIHLNEPGCAVLKAVQNGEIAESRYVNYLGLLQDMDEKYR